MPRVLIGGASGFVGSALVPFLQSQGWQVTRLVRGKANAAGELQWNPMSGVSRETVSGYDAVIHLSGENISGRWNQEKKRRIRDSRVVSTRNLSQALAESAKKPGVFLCASAIGFYGSRGDDPLTEESAPGTGFLAEVCREWEEATSPAASAGIRVVNLRIGIVLARGGGPLKQMLLPFRLGIGGPIGSGQQWWSWIHIADLVRAVGYTINENAIRGPVNLTAPHPATNAEFTRILARALHRPAFIPVPALAARVAFGEFADVGLLASARVIPKRLLDAHFQFRFSELPDALASILQTRRKPT